MITFNPRFKQKRILRTIQLFFFFFPATLLAQQTGEQAKQLEEVSVTGTRGTPRTKLTTAVPVDVIDVSKIASTSPQVSVGDILNYVAPSFSSNKQSIQDGTDHVDPASLRGMGVDQVLVLVNGKRLHQTSLVNVQTGPGRGQVSTDLNTIPTAAIERIEILRDGAAAQYGSDAIAGVINIILKKNTGKLQVNVTGGANVTGDESLTSKNKFADGEVVKVDANYGFGIGKKGGFLNLTGAFNYRGRTNRSGPNTGTIFRDYNQTDNGVYKYDYKNFISSYGATEASASKYFTDNHLTGADITDAELARRGKTRNDYQMIVGQSGLVDGKGYLNFELPIVEDKLTLFVAGGVNYRRGRASGFFRSPVHPSRYVPELYPDGYLPHINSTIVDYNAIAGVRGQFAKTVKWELSYTQGANRFDFDLDKSVNVSYMNMAGYAKKPQTTFNAGGHAFTQRTINLDLSNKFDVLEGLNVAVGGEMRMERFQIFKGEESSYGAGGKSELYTPKMSKDANGAPKMFKDVNGADSVGVNSGIRPAGAQVFPGFQRAVDRDRTSFAAYLDAELDVTKAWLVGAALRYEHYSDFGSVLTYKLTTRYRITDFLSARFAYNTGFRAPSLHQLYFQTTTTQITPSGQLAQVAVLSNDNPAAAALGIPSLKAETSSGITGGFTLDFDHVTMTADFYNINVDNRIVFTDNIKGNQNGNATEKAVYDALSRNNAEEAQFFANAINTVTRGMDFVFTFKHKIGQGDFRADFATTIAQTSREGNVKTTALITDPDLLFPPISAIILEKAVSVAKASLGLTYTWKKLNVMLRNSFFGEVYDAQLFTTIKKIDANNNIVLVPQEFKKSEPRIITDLSVGYQFGKYVGVTVGANNLFDIYPDKVDPKKFDDVNGGFRYQFGSSQFGYNGRFLFARVSITL